MSRVLLLVGEETTEVQAWLGAFPGVGWPRWGGVLRGVPTPLAAALHLSDDVRIRLLPSGQERRIRAAEMRAEDQGCVEVLFLGEGTEPSDWA